MDGMNRRPPGLLAQFRETAEMIKISHTAFALPFALAAAALALRAEGGWSWSTAGLIVVCAVAARTAAMAQNRLADHGVDAANPRTASRALPAGRVSRSFVLALVAGSSLVFVLGAAALNPLCGWLSPLVLALLLGYPFTKRFTLLCHFWLGAALGVSPIGAWLAVRGAFVEMTTPLLLAAAVLFWTAGFDLIYACQDAEHDRKSGLHSIPARLGIGNALRLSGLAHLVSVLLLAALFFSSALVGWLFGVGFGLAVLLLVYEHAIVRPDDLSRVDLAFFTLNGLVSLVLGATIIADAFL